MNTRKLDAMKTEMVIGHYLRCWRMRETNTVYITMATTSIGLTGIIICLRWFVVVRNRLSRKDINISVFSSGVSKKLYAYIQEK
jgi:hypothetical protein